MENVEVSKNLTVHVINQIIMYNIARCENSIHTNKLILSDLLQELDSQGHAMGVYVAHRLTISHSPIWDEKKGLVFLCKNVWPFLFQKQADKLQTDDKGTFLIVDSSIPWIANITTTPTNPKNTKQVEARSLILVQSYKAFISGILRGVLDSLGIYSTVDFQEDETNKLSCTFKVLIKKADN